MEKNLSELVKISRTVGKNSLLTQGGGGNTSVKSDDGKFMYIKASGTALKDMSSKKGWRRLRLEKVLEIMKDKSTAKLDISAREIEVVRRLRLACDDNVKGQVRPSVESHLHAMLDKFVIHLHPAAVLSYGCAKNGRQELEKLFKDEKFPPLWVGYADPGFMLAMKITKLVGGYQRKFKVKPAILFLEKHGLLISAKSASAALRSIQRVIKKCDSKLVNFKSAKVKRVNQKDINRAKIAIRKATGQKALVHYFFDSDIAAFLRRGDVRELLSFGALTPDELLYANGPAMRVGKNELEKIEEKLCRQVEKGIKGAVAFLVEDTGLFIVGTKQMAPAVLEIVRNSFFIRINAVRLGGISVLSKKQQEFVYNWEADAFRKKIAEG
ncbi:MAG: class II aldolase [Sedimentisphaerales bacterium]|nr:class II aldolase [Sedimentisphaerales bacterium]